MRVIIASLLMIACLAGCVTQDYVGEQYAPTEFVRVFYDDARVPAGYSVIGRDRAEAIDDLTAEMIVQQMVEKAKQVGADAILVTGVDTVDVGERSVSSGWREDDTAHYATWDGRRHKRHQRTGEWHEDSYTAIVRDKIVTAKFLKQ